MGWSTGSVVFGAVFLCASSAWAWDTDDCSSGGRTTDGACTVASNGVQGSGSYGPVGRKTNFDASETIGIWTSVNNPPGGTNVWLFECGRMTSASGGWGPTLISRTTTLNVSGGANFWSAWHQLYAGGVPMGRWRCQVYYDPAGPPTAWEVPANSYVEFRVCGSNYEQRCVNGDVYWFDACGQQRSRAVDCPTGSMCSASGGTASCSCTPNTETRCYNGDVYNYDSCGSRGSLAASCTGGRTCSASGGSASCGCTPNTETRCYNGDVYNYDSCGKRGSIASSCTGGQMCNASGSSASCGCTPNTETRCYNGDVYNYDSCGSRGSLAASCTGGQMCNASGGSASCGCTPNTETRCYNGDVYNYDSCGLRGGLAAACSAGETCMENAGAASCGCTPNTELRCNNGDVYNYDSCGNVGALERPCNMGCSNGACLQGPGPRRPFDETCIMSDAVFEDVVAMSAAEVQQFLATRNGRLDERDLWQSIPFALPGTLAYQWQFNDGSLARQNAPADVIHFSAIDAAQPPNNVNAQVLITMLQKEQSLVDDPARATANVMDWAMGYGVPDSGNRNTNYQGFASQVLGTAFSLTQSFEADPSEWANLPPIDGVTIVPRSRATYALYRHTPHIHGNRLFYDLFWDYFGDPGQCPTSQVPTVSGLPSSPSVPIDESLPLTGTVRADGEDLTRVTVAITGPGLQTSNRSLTTTPNAPTFDLSGFSFSPSAIGLAAATYHFGVWAVTESRAAELIGVFNVRVLPAATGVAFLSFPLAAHQADTAPINSVFDHAMTQAYAHDGRVVAFTGEEGRVMCGGDSTTRTTPGYHRYRDGMCRPGETYSVDGHYRYRNDPIDKFKLYYDDHPGYDFQANRGTQIHAPAAGTVRTTWYGRNGACPRLEIDHGNGYTSVFLHTATRTTATSVQQGDVVGTVGATCTGGPHLHYEVKKTDQQSQGFHRVDPYGWQGQGAEPYTVDPSMPRLWISSAAIGGEVDRVCTGGCASGTACVDGECLFTCQSATDCEAGEACVDGACASVCYPVPLTECDPGVPFNPGDGTALIIDDLPAGPEGGAAHMPNPQAPVDEPPESDTNAPPSCLCAHTGTSASSSTFGLFAALLGLGLRRRRSRA